MNIEIKVVGNVTLSNISGKMDGKTAPMVQDQLLPIVKNGAKLLLALDQLTFMASAGLRVLLSLRKQIQPNGGIALTGLSDHLKDTLEITGFLDYFDIYETMEEGLAALSAES